jgi:hypothetical protein
VGDASGLRRGSLSRTLIFYEVVLCVVCAAIAAGAELSADQRAAFLPLVGLAAVSGAFWICLSNRDQKSPLFELGSFCMLATVVYGAIPLVWYILSGAQFSPLSHQRLYLVNPTPDEFAAIGWMYVVYAATLAGGYLLLRDRGVAPVQVPLLATQSQFLVLIFFFCGFQLAFALLSLLYGVQSNVAYNNESLYTSYAAYSQLPLAARQIVDWAHAAAVVVNCAIVTILAARWRDRVWRAVLVGWIVLSIVIYLISPGGRFLLVSMIVTALLAYDRFVSRIRAGRAFAALAVLFAAFVVAGALRGGDSDSLASAGGELLERTDDLKALFTISNEFQISYGSAIELKYLAAHGLLDPAPWQLCASELLMLVPAQLLPFEKVDPVLWYVGATHDPDFFTYGVIAQSIMGLSWFEVVLRGLLVGVLLAVVHNWWVRSPASLWRNVFYIWLAVVSYYTVRNTSLYLITLVVLRFVPVVLAVQFCVWLLRAVAAKARARSTGVGSSESTS